MNTQQHSNLADQIDAVAAWLLGGLGRMFRFLEQRPAGTPGHADPARVRVPMPEAQVSRNRLYSGHFRNH